MSTEDYNDEGGAQECSYCASSDECAHVLLIVDRTFRTAEGGVLIDAFNERWSKLCEDGGDDFEEREPFENLLDEVDAFRTFQPNTTTREGQGCPRPMQSTTSNRRTRPRMRWLGL
ncbi:hypothetical protein SAMN05216404_10916 [Nitrosospira multiformis]|uniref:Uncharacterized protein n=1 Tax=Nitrosospira multiformis TaxID=1231 RepID=A0A1H8KQZ0_9PROT|nr:hypothetical protein [Nitrosospira multiformis]SEN95319.1 hypothetical protein SAMN05216404_10916 [Nitrosospira multiformis]